MGITALQNSDMETNYVEEEGFYRAKKKVEEIKSFYVHLVLYILCNIIVVAVNLMTSPGYLYFWYSLLGWGVAIVLHALKAFDFAPFFNKDWEQRKVKELMKKEEYIRKTWE